MAHDLCVAAGHDCTIWNVQDVMEGRDDGVARDRAEGTDIVTEMCNSSAPAKRALLERMNGLTPGEATWHTPALVISATQAAAWLASPDRLVGFGLIAPLGDRPVIELAAALQLAESHLAAAEELWQGAGFETVMVSDGPGLVRARIRGRETI